MNTAKGNVEVISERAAGKGTAFNFKLDDGEWYSYGFKAPKFKRGDFVEFEFSGQYKNVDVESVLIKAGAEQPTASKAKGGTDWEAKDKRITYLAARNSAIAAVTLLIDAGAIKIGTKEADKYAIVTGAIDKIAGEYFQKSWANTDYVAEEKQQEKHDED
jgi:hypothetical protein